MTDLKTPAGKARFSRASAKVGAGLAAFVIFLCGWFAMHTDDWRAIVGFTFLALAAGAAASAFARRARE